MYKLPALSAKICACFLDEVKNIAKQYPNVQLNYQGMILNQFGFDCYFEHLASYLSPLLVQLYPALTSNTPFEMQYVSAIVVHYNANVTPEREGHFEHVDDSDLTLNMVLNPESSFSGGELYIRVLGTVNMGKETGYTCVPHEFGSGILHQGKAAHSSASMRNGSRYNLVVWFKAVPLSYYDKVVPFAIEIHYDVRTLVANFLDVATLYHFMQTSKQNMQIANDSKIWFQIYSQKRNARIKSPIVYDATTNWKSKLKEKDYEPELEYLVCKAVIFIENNVFSSRLLIEKLPIWH